MKIDNSIKGSPGPVTGGAARQQSPAKSAATPDSPASSQVRLSSLASLGVDKVLADAPVTDTNKIAEIKQAIAEGRFTVNADKIADGLIDSVRQMLGKSNQN